MRIGLIGYGRMGREIQKIAETRGHRVVAVFDEDSRLKAASDLKGAEVLIDFSLPEAVVDNLKTSAEHGVPVVEGTTGWYDRLGEVRAIRGLSLLYSANFSTGVYLFMALVREAGKLLGKTGDYDCSVHEWHHRGKVDSPSGTARRLAEILLETLPEKTSARYDIPNQRIAPHELHVTASRIGRVPGTHEVNFDSLADSIQVRHTAHGRDGFALGAVKGGEWLLGRRGVFSMDDFMAGD